MSPSALTRGWSGSERQTAMLGCDGDDTSAAEADSQATPASTQTERDNPSYDDGSGAGSGQVSRPANYTQPSKSKHIENHI